MFDRHSKSQQKGQLMEQIKITDAFRVSSEYQKMLPKDRVQWRKKRLYDLVTYARENSPFYHDLYANLPEHFTLNNLPTTTRENLQSHYNDWSTDQEVTLDGVYAYLEAGVQSSKLYLDKYHVISTSGTDESPLTILYDKNAARIMSAAHFKKCFSRKEHFWNYIKKGAKSAAIYTTGGSYINNVCADMRRRYLPFGKSRSLILPSQNATSALVATLNRFKPAMLSGFPSALSRLADERKASRLKINPVCIMADGEPLTDDLRAKLERIFHCDVTSSYSCAEAGTIAYECREHHLHLNDDLVIVEPVTFDGNPVEDGVTSDKVLITNLVNYTHPIIRYALDDKITLHDTPCLCGNPSPWITIAGRSLDQVVFTASGREIFVPIEKFETSLKNVAEIKRYQILVYPGNHLSLRILAAKGSDKTLAFFKAEKVLRAYMRELGVLSPAITLEKEDPQPDPLSGKYSIVIAR